MKRFRSALTPVALLLCLAQYGQSLQTSSPGTLPQPFEDYVTSVARLNASERKKLLSGSPVVKFLDSDAGKEVAVFGAAWINAPSRRYVEAVNNIEYFERGKGFRITKRIATPPRLEDFTELRLPKEDMADLKSCRAGDCELKLSQNGIETLRKGVDWSDPAAQSVVEERFRELAHGYVTGYIARGNEGLAVYRDGERPTFIAVEFESLVDRMPELTSYLPEIQRCLLEYPDVTLSDSAGFLYWQETRFGLKPTIRINHLVIKESPESIVVVTKMLYASHDFWTALELRVLAPDPSRGSGFWLITVNRSRSDGLSGFTRRVIRERVRGEVREGVLASLNATKRTMESPLQ